MREVELEKGFSLKEVKDRVRRLGKELDSIMANRKERHNKRCYDMVNFSLAWLKTYSYFMELAPDIDKETFNKIYEELIRQRDSVADYAVFGGKQR